MNTKLHRYKVLVGRHVDGDRTYIAGTKDCIVVTDRDLLALMPGKFEDLGPVPQAAPPAPPVQQVAPLPETSPSDEDDDGEAGEEASEEEAPPSPPVKKAGKKKGRSRKWD